MVRLAVELGQRFAFHLRIFLEHLGVRLREKLRHPLVGHATRTEPAPGAPLPFGTVIRPSDLPGVYTPSGVNILASGNSKTVPDNTVWDVTRFDQALAALSPSHLISPLNASAIAQNFKNACLGTWSFSMERSLHG